MEHGSNRAWAARLRRPLGALAALSLCFGVGGGVLAVATGTAGAASAAATSTLTSPKWTHHHRPHYLSSTAIDNHFAKISVPSASKNSGAIANLAEGAGSTVTGARAAAAAVPETIPSGVTIDVNSTAYAYYTTFDTVSSTCGITVTGTVVCTLAEALQTAGYDGTSTDTTPPVAATINLPAGTYAVTGSLYAWEPAGLTIDGAGASTTIITAQGLTRVLKETPYTSLAINGVTITGGNNYNTYCETYWETSRSTYYNCETTGSVAAVRAAHHTKSAAAHAHPAKDSPSDTGTGYEQWGCGGGIDETWATDLLELSDDVITANTATTAGGGICANGELYVESTTVSDNTVSPSLTFEPVFAAIGGGIAVGYYTLGAVRLSSATVTGNSVNETFNNLFRTEGAYFGYGAGGGLGELYGSSTTVVSSNVSTNEVLSQDTSCSSYTSESPLCQLLVGGGLYNADSNLIVTGSTVDSNSVHQDGYCARDCEYGALGGGVANFGGTTLTDDTVDANALYTQTPTSTAETTGMNNGQGAGVLTYDPIVITGSTVDYNTLTGSTTADDECAISGGAGIFAGSPGLYVATSSVSHNTVTDGSGGGIVLWDPGTWNDYSPTTEFQTGSTLTNDNITDNTAATTQTYGTNPPDFGSGAGLYVQLGEIDEGGVQGATSTPAEDDEDLGTVRASGLSIDGNTAATFAGGLWVTTGTVMDLTSSTIADNTAYLGGGVLETYEGVFNATNSTIADNSATGTQWYEDDLPAGGGGIYLTDDALANLTYDTISGNSSATDGGGIESAYVEDDAGVHAVGTIIANNTATGVLSTEPAAVHQQLLGTPGETDCAIGTVGATTTPVTFPLLSGGWNLGGDDSCHLTQPTDRYSVSADLGPLTDNGGHTLTMEPNFGSPAITNGGGSPTCPATDERGVTRPQGPKCDIGAVEVVVGYYLAGADGGVFAFGGAAFYGSAVGATLNSPVVGIASMPDGHGYWLATASGGVYPFGTAVSYGTEAVRNLVGTIVGIVSSPDGKGYTLVASDGGVFAFGDAQFHGSLPGLSVSTATVVGMAITPTGGGYWLTGATGGVYAFGNALYHGSESGKTIAAPISGIAGTATGQGYWLVGQDGGVYTFNAVFHGSAYMLKQPTTFPLHAPAYGIATTAGGGGYLQVGGDGGVFAYGSAAFQGSLPGIPLTVTDIVGIAIA